MFTSSSKTIRSTIVAMLFGVTAMIFVTTATVSTQRPHFYPDDPIAREPESQDASKAQPNEIEQMYEQIYNLFIEPGRKSSGTRAQNINTIDEVPDSSWFTNRVGTRPISVDDLTRGTNVGAPPDPSKWVLTREKTSGAHPGFTAKDAKGETSFSSSIRRTTRKGRRRPSRLRRRFTGRSATTRSSRTSRRSIRRTCRSIRTRPSGGPPARGPRLSRTT